MKILVLGSRGQLGAALTRRLISTNYIVSAPHHKELDITHIQAIITHVNDFKPDVIVNCAAIHDREFCEENESKAVAVNVQAVRWLSAIAKVNGIRFYHISTDQVLRFPPNLQTEDEKFFYYDVYSKTKRDSEKALEPGQTTFRVSALYGHDPCRGIPEPNFVEQIVEFVDKFEGKPLYLPDNVGCSPGYTEDIANILTRFVRIEGLPPLIHLAPKKMSGTYTWFQFAWDIIEIYVNQGSLVPAKYLKPKETHKPPTGIVNMTTKYGWILPPVRESLKRYFEKKKHDLSETRVRQIQPQIHQQVCPRCFCQ